METLGISALPTFKTWRLSNGAVALVIGEVIRLVIAAVFLYSGLSKLRAPYEFLAAVYGYQLTGPFLSLIIATVLPWLEVLVAICLWTNLLFRGAMIMSMFIAAIFSFALGCALYRQLDISCGCFLAADKISYFTLIRSMSLLSAAAIGLVLRTKISERSIP